MKSCATCGKEIKADKKICGFCGSAQPEIEVEQTRLKVASGNRSLVALLISIVVFVATSSIAAPAILSKFHLGQKSPVSTATPQTEFIPQNVQLALAAPHVGDCWLSKSWATNYVSDYYASGSKIACSHLHDSVTYYVGAIPESVNLVYEPGVTLSGYPVNADGVNAIVSICQDQYQQQFGTQTTRLRTLYFLPDPYAWAAGARWVRCDVYATKWGSKVGSEVGAKVVSGLQTTFSHYSKNDYQICLNVGASGAPFNTDSTYADCDGSWDYKLVAEKDISDEGTDYPGLTAVSTEATSFCTAQAPNSIGYYPTESGWTGGNKVIRCWESGDSNN